MSRFETRSRHIRDSRHVRDSRYLRTKSIKSEVVTVIQICDKSDIWKLVSHCHSCDMWQKYVTEVCDRVLTSKDFYCFSWLGWTALKRIYYHLPYHLWVWYLHPLQAPIEKWKHCVNQFWHNARFCNSIFAPPYSQDNFLYWKKKPKQFCEPKKEPIWIAMHIASIFFCIPKILYSCSFWLKKSLFLYIKVKTSV